MLRAAKSEGRGAGRGGSGCAWWRSGSGCCHGCPGAWQVVGSLDGGGDGSGRECCRGVVKSRQVEVGDVVESWWECRAAPVVVDGLGLLLASLRSYPLIHQGPPCQSAGAGCRVVVALPRRVAVARGQRRPAVGSSRSGLWSAVLVAWSMERRGSALQCSVGEQPVRAEGTLQAARRASGRFRCQVGRMGGREGGPWGRRAG